MPCNSDYLAPTEREKRYRESAQLAIWLYEQLGKKPTKKMINAAADIYGRGGDFIPLLCKELSALNPHKRDNIVYNTRDKMARKLADWWEEHQAADAARIEAENKESRKAALVASAKKKLTKEEFAALEAYFLE